MKRLGGYSVYLLAVVLFGSTTASASLIPTFTNDTGPAAGIFTWNYDVVLDAQQNLIAGSEICFAGVQGLTGTPTAPAGWTASNENGACPISAGVTSPNIGPSVLDIYSGPTVLGGADLGNFTFQSTLGVAGTSNLAYGAIAQKKSNLSITANQGQLNGPIAAVPETTSLLMLSAGLALIGIGRGRGSKPTQPTH